MESTLYRKNRVNLEDYDYKKDIQNRLLMTQFSEDDFEILEEIIYNPTKFPIDRLVKQLGKSLKEVLNALERLAKNRVVCH